jgi:hypothetical protein
VGRYSQRAPLNYLPFPNLPPISTQEVIDLQKRLSYNKAISYDGISDRAIKNVKNHALLQDIWNQRSIDVMKDLGKSRLLALNKVWPNIPKADEFRPIVILSPLYKFLELRFLPKLNHYLLNRMAKNQTGFVPGLGTQVNISQIIKIF